jgi:hypothetical protein
MQVLQDIRNLTLLLPGRREKNPDLDVITLRMLQELLQKNGYVCAANEEK